MLTCANSKNHGQHDSSIEELHCPLNSYETQTHICKFVHQSFPHWKQCPDEDGIATLYHIGLQHIDANSVYGPQHLPGFEKELFDTGSKGGYSKQTRCKYESPSAVRELRAQRRQAVERSIN